MSHCQGFAASPTLIPRSLARFSKLKELERAKPDGLPPAEWEKMASTRLDAATMRRAMDLYVPIRGRVCLTGRGLNVLVEARRRAAPAERPTGVRRRIDVTLHAVERAQQRRLVTADSKHEARLEIARAVDEGLDAGRYSRTKPKWLTLYGERGPALGGRLYGGENRGVVWSESRTEAWVVAKDPDGSWIVLSTLIGPGIKGVESSAASNELLGAA
jgi:hypothetical protein